LYFVSIHGYLSVTGKKDVQQKKDKLADKKAPKAAAKGAAGTGKNKKDKNNAKPVEPVVCICNCVWYTNYS